MTEQHNDDDDLPEEAKAWFEHMVATEGLRVAYETAIGICRDPKAPTPAKATSLTALLRSAGMFDRKDGDDRKKEHHEMTAAELQREDRRLERQRNGPRKTSTTDGVFD